MLKSPFLSREQTENRARNWISMTHARKQQRRRHNLTWTLLDVWRSPRKRLEAWFSVINIVKECLVWVREDKEWERINKTATTATENTKRSKITWKALKLWAPPSHDESLFLKTTFAFVSVQSAVSRSLDSHRSLARCYENATTTNRARRSEMPKSFSNVNYIILHSQCCRRHTMRLRTGF